MTGVQSRSRHKLWKTLVFHPPRRETPSFARLVEEDDVSVRIAQPRLAPHPRLVARAVLEGEPAPCQLLDALVEIVAFEIDRGRRDDLFLGVDLDREGHSARSLEARISGVGTIDDLVKTEAAVEIDRPLVVRARDRDLVEPRARADI